MEKENLAIVALTTGLGALAGGYAESCMDGQQCWQPTKYEASAECQNAPLPPSCVAQEIGQVLVDIPGPAIEHPHGAEVGGALGLFSGLALAVLANRLDRRGRKPYRI